MLDEVELLIVSESRYAGKKAEGDTADCAQVIR
ncbi:MAG: hypothetical protein IEMM0002_0575 [bacterium]|nr:MAG: hypothetical protein IEMM0002_0575 [bacterium]